MRIPAANGTNVDVSWTVKMYSDYCRAIQLIPSPNEPHFAEVADTLSTFAAVSVQIATNYQSVEADLNRIRTLVVLLYQRSQKEAWKRPEDHILSLCYHLLAHKVIDRRQAHQLALQVLGEDKAGNDVDLWRKRVDYFAHTRHLPAVAKRGRPRKQ